MPLYEMVKGTYYFYILNLKDKIFIRDAKIKEEPLDVKALFLDPKRQPFRKTIMPKSINYQ